MIITNVEVTDAAVVVYTTLPGPDAGLSKADILRVFARELANEYRYFAEDALGRALRLNGRMTVEMAVIAGVVAARLGASSVELFDPSTGGYTPVMGANAPLPMPIPVQPGMVVRVTRGGLFREGAEAVVLNVGHEQVNIADLGGGRRSGRRDTGWTALDNVRPVRWERPPRLE